MRPGPAYGPKLETDERIMLQAVNQAKLALWEGQAGYGCVIVDNDGHFLGAGRGSETPTDCTCHSEVVAIREATARNGLLFGATLYSTTEPCMYCCGAINHSKVSRVVWGSARSDSPSLYRQRTYHARDLLLDTSTPAAITAGVLRTVCLPLTTPAVKTFVLPCGATVAVDDEKWATQGWYLSSKGYVVRSENGYTRRLNRDVMGLKKGDPLESDHINGDKLDNRAENLRVCTHAQNVQNAAPLGGRSAYRGVTWDRGNKKWKAGVRVDGKSIHLGMFHDELEAAAAASAGRDKYFTHHNRERDVR